jgi:hypothetical protein
MKHGMKLRIILMLAIFWAVSACNRNNRHPVPYFQFDVTINLNLPSYSPLMGVGGWAYLDNVGSRGVIIYRSSSNQFVAFDRHSPADEAGNCPNPLYPDEENFFVLIDECNDARFSLLDGSPWNDSQYTDWGLRAYQTTFDGGSNLRVFNP